jgi:hypothetical protein
VLRCIKHGIRYWLLRNLPACRRTVEVISDSMDRALSRRERILVKLHLWVCAWCQWYLEHQLTIRETLRAQPTEADELTCLPSLSPDARKRLKEKIRGY